MKKILMLCMVLLLVGCQENKIDTPSDLSADASEITWTGHEADLFYTLKINQDEVLVYENFYSLKHLNNGTYTISVKASDGNRNSSYSKSIKVEIDRPFDLPTGLYINNSALIFNLVEGATSYHLYVDGVLRKTSQTHIIDVSDLPKSNIYELKVKAIYPDGQSDFSNPIDFIYFNPPGTVYESLIYLNRSYDFYVDLYGITPLYVKFDHQVVHPSLYKVKDGYLLLDPYLLKDQSKGTTKLELYTEDQRIDYSIDMTERVLPYLASPSQINYKGEDLLFHLELYGESIEKIVGIDLLETDYVLDGETLTIKASYIERRLEAQASLDRINIYCEFDIDDLKFNERIYINIQ